MTDPLRRPTRLTTSGRIYLDLRGHARASGRDTGELMQFYALEGFLDRLTRSPFSDRFVLKGGVLLAAFGTRRPTRDVDVAAIGLRRDAGTVLDSVRAIATIEVDDGLGFDTEGATAAGIREDERYGGVRITMPCGLDRARLHFHVDVNLGDPISPGPRAIVLPRLLGGSIRMLGYPLGMVVAEKLVTAVERGEANTRWRDFGDLYTLSRSHDQDGDELCAAIQVVAAHRGVELHEAITGSLSFAELAQPKWELWRRRQRLEHLPNSFGDVLAQLAVFATAALDGSARGLRWRSATSTWANPE